LVASAAAAHLSVHHQQLQLFHRARNRSVPVDLYIQADAALE